MQDLKKFSPADVLMRSFPSLEDIGSNTLVHLAVCPHHGNSAGQYPYDEPPINMRRLAVRIARAEPDDDFLALLNRYSKRCVPGRLKFLALIDEYEAAYTLECVTRTTHAGGLRGVEAVSINSDLSSAPTGELLDEVLVALPKLTTFVLMKPAWNWDVFVEKLGAKLTHLEVHFQIRLIFYSLNLETVSQFANVAQLFVNIEELVINYAFWRSFDIAETFAFLNVGDAFPRAKTVHIIDDKKGTLFGIGQEDIERFRECEAGLKECRPFVDFFVHERDEGKEYHGSFLGYKYGPTRK